MSRRRLVALLKIRPVIADYVPIGSDNRADCPFHDDGDRCLCVDEIARAFRCCECGATGDVVDFVARYANISDREAVAMLSGLF